MDILTHIIDTLCPFAGYIFAFWLGGLTLVLIGPYFDLEIKFSKKKYRAPF